MAPFVSPNLHPLSLYKCTHTTTIHNPSHLAVHPHFPMQFMRPKRKDGSTIPVLTSMSNLMTDPIQSARDFSTQRSNISGSPPGSYFHRTITGLTRVFAIGTDDVRKVLGAKRA